MSGIKRAGMLLALLAAPAFFFLFLKTCGTNHYDLPYFHPLKDAAGHVILKGSDTVYYQVSGVLGIAPDGDTITSAILEGHVNAFYLGPGNPEIGDRSTENRNRILDRLASEDTFQFIERVAQPDMKGYASPAVVTVKEASDLNRWEDLLKVGKKYGTNGTFYENSSLVLVDSERYIRGYFDLSDPDDFDRSIAEVKVLLYNKRLAEK